jgi:hypothetical protein
MSHTRNRATTSPWGWGLLGGLLLVAAAARLLPHPPNLTPVIALALFCGAAMPQRFVAVGATLGLMLVSDLFLGFHSGMPVLYMALAIICLLGSTVQVNSPVRSIAGRGVLAASLFFVISNLGVWAFSGMYAHNWAGLTQCFTLAIPFFGNTLVGTAIYGGVLFGIGRQLPLESARGAAPVAA